ncbi:receptor-like protein kinase FERONIA [Pyrus ussuriensis x Pyrus communis]|uniref:Receptor-like protein kinase FERONIA n=1 Tax=Pyrus ussuriensis x Pyrus communis TaxID=2448454 RepID=A0A5N5GWU7_9ROSA|nr:receptor-like protein kinase FERONIA [Pyrus ussuriensis x Pyrus communis]
MMKPIFMSHLSPSLFLHIIIATTLVAADPPPIYNPVEDITVQCGSSGQFYNPYDKRNWNGDISSKFTPIDLHRAAGSNTSMSKEAPRSFSVPQIPYTTVRLSRSEFTYRFNLTAGQKFIRLYFYPISYPDFDRSEALFSVKASGFTLLKDFNASVNADADRVETLYREFCINIEEEEQSLNITFTPCRSKASPDAYAFINGIEIVSMPPNLYYTAPEDPYGIEIIGNENTIRVENNTAMETVYRINIGGGQLFFNKDTGLYRNWESYSFEQTYLDNASFWSSVLPKNTSLHLNFSKTPNYSAPELVYQTGRSMGPDPTINQRHNLTWRFPVHPKFFYLVRLHFCEFEPQIKEISDRVFQIYIANQTAETRADIIEWSGGNGIPTYRDYVVFMPSGTGNEKKVSLSITLQPHPMHWRISRSVDAILNGLEIFKMNDTNGNLAGSDPNPPLPHPKEVIPPRKKGSRTHFIAVVAGAVSAALVVLSVLGLLSVFRHRQKYVKGYGHSSHKVANSTKSRGGTSLPSALCHYFSLEEIKAATENFNDTFIIGVGGFGNVYKGYIDDGATPIAIKRLKPESTQGPNEFKTEIELLSQLRHRNLVSLIGYSTDKNEMILVYDYMSRGTLADNLYHSNNPPLAWGQRLQICIGAAQGLNYLHSAAKGTIIHRDVKSTNILLDEKWVAKVSDFGLSKMGMTTTSKTHISTMVKGSFGYLDPEYYRRQQLTDKSDVYSFGVVLLEVLCARPALMHKVEQREMNLAVWARFCHREGTLDQIIDRNLKGKIEAECLNIFIEIAISCIHDKGVERPSMKEVVKGLEFALQLHQKNVGSNGDGGVTGVSTEQGCASNESIQCISATIFSEINDPIGR